MSVFEFLAILLLLIITPTMVMFYRVLRRMEKQAIELSKIMLESIDSSLHDIAHPVFSAKQVRERRLYFEHQFKKRVQREHRLTEGNDWAPPDKAAPSEATLEKMREVCEAIVDAESSWKEYAFMVSANLRVANRGESGKAIVAEWKTVLEETHGSAALYSIGPPAKHARVNEFLGPWIARLRGEKSDGASDELFNGPWDNRHQLIERFRYEP